MRGLSISVVRRRLAMAAMIRRVLQDGLEWNMLHRFLLCLEGGRRLLMGRHPSPALLVERCSVRSIHLLLGWCAGVRLLCRWCRGARRDSGPLRRLLLVLATIFPGRRAFRGQLILLGLDGWLWGRHGSGLDELRRPWVRAFRDALPAAQRDGGRRQR